MSTTNAPPLVVVGLFELLERLAALCGPAGLDVVAVVVVGVLRSTAFEGGENPPQEEPCASR